LGPPIIEQDVTKNINGKKVNKCFILIPILTSHL